MNHRFISFLSFNASPTISRFDGDNADNAVLDTGNDDDDDDDDDDDTIDVDNDGDDVNDISF